MKSQLNLLRVCLCSTCLLALACDADDSPEACDPEVEECGSTDPPDKTVDEFCTYKGGSADAYFADVPDECIPVGLEGTNTALPQKTGEDVQEVEITFKDGVLILLGTLECTYCALPDVQDFGMESIFNCAQYYECTDGTNTCRYTLRAPEYKNPREWMLFFMEGFTSMECPPYGTQYWTIGPVNDAGTCAAYCENAGGASGPRECGDDGCGGSCGTCADGSTCEDGTCKTSKPTCPAGCQVGAVCCGGVFCSGDCVGTPCC